MAIQQQAARAVGIFEDQQHAVNAVHALTQAGIAPQQIVVVARDWKGHELPGPMVEAQHAADDGAIAGALVGASLGVAAGAVLSLIPGLGVAVIVLSAIGGLTGAAVGAYAGPFIALEMTEAEAQQHAEHVEQGRIVVVVKTADRQEEAESIMVEHGAYDFSMTAQPRVTVAAAVPNSELEANTMRTCELCGNEYDKAFTVTMADREHTFDSFECAIQALAPQCAHCGCKVIGHGVEQGSQIFCCVHCAKHAGVAGLKDRG